MAIVLKEPYLEAEIEITRFEARDVITTSAVIGDGQDSDDGGWTGSGNW
ncbi:MAG: hypothetical protein IJY69_03620 [Clostridia bacterium]|nr:hypothetical protein [Clostridia bacterium]